jgi:Spy/CpxP family protein refolding chaperone
MFQFTSKAVLRAAIAALLLIACSSATFAADGPAAAPPATRPGIAAVGVEALLSRIRVKLDDLNLTADQKTKIDAIFTKTGDDLKTMMAQGADPAERRQKVMQLLSDLKDQLGDVLDPQQKEQMQKLLAAIRPVQASGASKLVQLQKAIQSLDLTPDQRTKVLAVLEDLKAKVADLRAEAQAGKGADELKAKAAELRESTQSKLLELLTPDQQAKLKDLMTQEPPAKPDAGK